MTYIHHVIICSDMSVWVAFSFFFIITNILFFPTFTDQIIKLPTKVKKRPGRPKGSTNLSLAAKRRKTQEEKEESRKQKTVILNRKKLLERLLEDKGLVKLFVNIDCDLKISASMLKCNLSDFTMKDLVLVENLLTIEARDRLLRVILEGN